MILKTTVVLLAAYAAALCAARASASVRHAIMLAGMVGALVLPALTRFVPVWEVPAGVVRATAAPSAITAARMPPVDPATARSGVLDASPFPWGDLLFAVWIAGTVLSLAAIGVGIWRLRILSLAARPAGPEWDQLVNSLSPQLGMARAVRTLLTPHPLAPLTWGSLAPCILLPADALTWSQERRRIIVAHELAHVARGDWGAHLAGELLRAAYWFHPLVWMLCRRRQLESERACDDRVLGLGVDGAVYATEIVDLARSAHRHRWLPAPAIVRTSGLERRVRAMLNPRLNRRTVTTTGRVTIAAFAAAIVIAVAGISAAQALASFAGSVVDPSNAVLPGVRLVMTNTETEAKIEVRSDRNGRFEFPPLTPGTYAMVVELPGFSSLRSTMRLQGGQRVEPSLQMAVGELEETVTVRDPGPGGATEMPRIQSVNPRPIPPCGAGLVSDGRRIGGNIRPPAKIRNVPPVYPVNYRGSGRAQSVRLEAIIDENGTISDIRTVGSPLPDFEQSAITAVRQWAFDSTLLNCEPVEVRMQVHVYFAP